MSYTPSTGTYLAKVMDTFETIHEGPATMDIIAMVDWITQGSLDLFRIKEYTGKKRMIKIDFHHRFTPIRVWDAATIVGTIESNIKVGHVEKDRIHFPYIIRDDYKKAALAALHEVALELVQKHPDAIIWYFDDDADASTNYARCYL